MFDIVTWVRDGSAVGEDGEVSDTGIDASELVAIGLLGVCHTDEADEELPSRGHHDRTGRWLGWELPRPVDFERFIAFGDSYFTGFESEANLGECEGLVAMLTLELREFGIDLWVEKVRVGST